MIQVNFDKKYKHPFGGIARRDFLRIGALAPIGLSLPGWLSVQKTNAGQARRRRANSVVLIFLAGGISHHDTFDMKPDAPEKIRGKYKSIPTCVPGLKICELLPRIAQRMNKVSLIRSGAHDNDRHETATNWVLSGRFGSPFGDYPAMGAVVAHETGFSGHLPPYIAVPKNPFFSWELGKSAFLGGRYESFKAGDPNQADYRVRDLARNQPLAPDALERRRSLRQAIGSIASKIQENDQIATYDEFQQRAAQMILSPVAQEAFEMNREPAQVRDAYGRTTLGQSCLLARRLIERDVRFVTVNSSGWDHHFNIFDELDKMLPILDQGLSAFIDDMDQRGLLEETLVVVMGEFGRTPKINNGAGRDHWGQAGSMLFAGAGVGGGNVIGATNHDGSEVVERPVRPGDVCRTVYEALGIDPHKMLRTPDGRPIHILDEGEAIEELYA